MSVALKFWGILVIITTIVGTSVASFALWKLLVADARSSAQIAKEVSDKILREKIEKEGIIGTWEDNRYLFKYQQDAEEKYEKIRAYFYLLLGVLWAGAVMPIGFGIFLLAMSNVVKYLKRISLLGSVTTSQ